MSCPPFGEVKKKPARGVIWIRRWSDGGVPRRGERGVERVRIDFWGSFGSRG